MNRKAPVLESLFNKLAGLKKLIEDLKELNCFPVNIAKFLKTAFL